MVHVYSEFGRKANSVNFLIKSAQTWYFYSWFSSFTAKKKHATQDMHVVQLAEINSR